VTFDDDFLFAARVHAQPRGASVREEYRVWLEARGDERAELFIIEEKLFDDDVLDRARLIARAQEILTKSEKTRRWWKLVAQTASIRNCGAAPEERGPVRFAYECPRTWEELTPTANASARHCGTCERLVHLCTSREDAEERARRGECITVPSALASAVARDLTSAVTGRPDAIAMWAERVFG